MSATTPTPDVAGARRRRRRIVVGVLVGLLLVVGITSIPGIRRGLIDPAGREAVTGVDTVEMRDDVWEYFAFTPSVIAVDVGTTVTWTSTSRAEHNVVFTDGDGERVTSPLVFAGETWSHTFEHAGDLLYVCTLHEGMEGRVVVG